MSAYKHLIYADDATGALEVAAVMASCGMHARVDQQAQANDDCLIINGQSRHEDLNKLHPDYLPFRNFTKQFEEWPEARIIHKMDSTLRGNWAHEIKCLSELTQKDRVLVIPAFPDRGRLCIDGQLTVDGELVHRTAMAKDPLAPVMSSNVGSYLYAAGLSPVSLATDDEHSLSDWIHSKQAGVMIAQVRNQEQFNHAIKAASKFDGIIAGPSSLAGGLGRLSGNYQARTLSNDKKFLIICGSKHPVSHQQIGYASEELMIPCYAIESAPTDAELRTLLAEQHVIIKISDQVHNPQFGNMLESRMRVFLSQSQHCHLAIIGGETLFSLQDRQSSMRGIGEWEPGIPLSEMHIGGNAYQVLSKAGAFGDKALFERLLQIGSRVNTCD